MSNARSYETGSIEQIRARRLAKVAGLPEAPPQRQYLRPAWWPDGGAYVVGEDPLSRRRLGALRKLGSSNTAQSLGELRTETGASAQPQIAAPETWRPLGGAADLNRGNQIISRAFTPEGDLRVGTWSEPVFATAKSVGQDAEAMSLVLGLYVSPSIDADILQPVDVYARIEFGIGGASFSFDADWGSGSVIALPASYVRVAIVRTIESLGTPEDNPDLVASVALAYGAPPTFGRTGGAKRTHEYTLAVGASSGMVKVPPFATALSVSSNSSSPNAIVRFRGDSASSYPNTGYYAFTDPTNASDNADGARTLPGNARYYSVTNNGLASDAISVVFSLAI